MGITGSPQFERPVESGLGVAGSTNAWMRRRPGISLRLRLIGLIAVVLTVSLFFGVLIECLNASRSVRNEMHAAIQVGWQSIEDAKANLATSQTPQRDLDSLIASFKGNRHLRVSLVGDDGVIVDAEPHVETSPFGAAAAWFVDLIGVLPETERLPVTVDGRSYGTVILQTDPHNEILEVWDEFNDSMIVLLFFCGVTILLVYLFVGRALRPLDRLASAIEQVGHGAYETRIDADPVPELSRLYSSFNHMADRLAATDADNRYLNQRLLTLQEEERGDLARDLHDEVSPFLFAVNVDLTNVGKLFKQGRTAEIPEHLASIADAVSHMQSEVRGLLGRLQPAGLAEFGLADAVANRVSFWSQRNPDIDFQVEIAPDCERLDGLIGTTIYRIVQECLSNAMRHGRPSRIGITIVREAVGTKRVGCIVVGVVDDGRGMPESADIGFGLRSMAERVRATGGSLSFTNSKGGGLAVRATLPYLPAQETPPQEAEINS